MNDTKVKAAPPPRSTRFRYFVLMSIICGSTFVIVSFSRSGDILMKLMNQEDRFVPNPTDEKYTLDTKGCRIPYLDILDDSIKDFVFYPNNMGKCHNSNKSLLEVKDSIVSIKRENLKYYRISNISRLSCCYEAFERPAVTEDISAIDVDSRVQYKPCVHFADKIQLNDEFVRITCNSTDRKARIFRQFYLTAIKKKFHGSEHGHVPEMSKNRTSYNIIIMGIDAVSRLNMYRTMPKTIKFIEEYGAVDLVGYNKVGDNTFPNLVPMLMGTRDTDLKHMCLPTDTSHFDNCPFVWNLFKQAGYFTALAEDTARLGTFNFWKSGFRDTPTDYYAHTFIEQAEIFVGFLKEKNAFICMNDKYFYQVLLDYIKDLSIALKDDKLFGFFWEVTMSHDYLNYPRVMDDRYFQFFSDLEKSGYLNKTIILLLSDHGIRWGGIRYTKQGRLEERLPFSFVIVPPTFRNTYSKAYSNLRLNGNRLTTPFDIHATLLDLINLSKITDDAIYEKSKSFYAHDRGISLFLPIPENRTCVMADIDDHWCTCHRGTVLKNQSSESIEAALMLVEHLNTLLGDHPQCARLNISVIEQVVKVEGGSPDTNDDGWREYLVMVRTTPGNALLEGTLKKEQQAWTLAGTVSRLNLYGNQSHCVDNTLLKLYCYCSQTVVTTTHDGGDEHFVDYR